MYHYVRDFEVTRYPSIKGLDVRDFRAQLTYLGRHYTFVTVDECLSALDSGDRLPPAAVLLTFDDGYIDHCRSCFQSSWTEGSKGCSLFPQNPSWSGPSST